MNSTPCRSIVGSCFAIFSSKAAYMGPLTVPAERTPWHVTVTSNVSVLADEGEIIQVGHNLHLWVAGPGRTENIVEACREQDGSKDYPLPNPALGPQRNRRLLTVEDVEDAWGTKRQARDTSYPPEAASRIFRRFAALQLFRLSSATTTLRGSAVFALRICWAATAASHQSPCWYSLNFRRAAKPSFRNAMMEGSFIQALSGVMGRTFPVSFFFRGRAAAARMLVAKLEETLRLTMSCTMAAKSPHEVFLLEHGHQPASGLPPSQRSPTCRKRITQVILLR
eukprot:gene6896-biopygen4203